MCFWDLMGQNGSNDHYYYSNWRISTFHPWNLNPKTTLNCSESKGDCIKAKTEMLKWIFRYKEHGGVWKEKVRALGVCPRPDSAEGGDGAFNERGEGNEKMGREAGRARHDRCNPKGQALPRAGVRVSLRCRKSYMQSRVPMVIRDKQRLRHCHRLEETTGCDN